MSVQTSLPRYNTSHQQLSQFLPVTLSQARDSLMWFGGLYTALVGGITVGVPCPKSLNHEPWTLDPGSLTLNPKP